jgi:hypothetical protein
LFQLRGLVYFFPSNVEIAFRVIVLQLRAYRTKLPQPQERAMLPFIAFIAEMSTTSSIPRVKYMGVGLVRFIAKYVCRV